MFGVSCLLIVRPRGRVTLLPISVDVNHGPRQNSLKQGRSRIVAVHPKTPGLHCGRCGGYIDGLRPSSAGKVGLTCIGDWRDVLLSRLQPRQSAAGDQRQPESHLAGVVRRAVASGRASKPEAFGGGLDPAAEVACGRRRRGPIRQPTNGREVLPCHATPFVAQAPATRGRLSLRGGRIARESPDWRVCAPCGGWGARVRSAQNVGLP